MSSPARIVLALSLFSPWLSTPAFAQWQVDGVPVCTVASVKSNLRVVPDGSGGALILWLDDRIGRHHVYMQHLDASVNPLWNPDGLPIIALNGDMESMQATSDGTGGAFVAWAVVVDAQGTTDAYMQRIGGNSNPLWGVDGVELCSAASSQFPSAIIADGYFNHITGETSGCIVAWNDQRAGLSNVYAQHLDEFGNKLWPDLEGKLCSTEVEGASRVHMCTDGIGRFGISKGAYLVWDTSLNELVRGQHLAADG